MLQKVINIVTKLQADFSFDEVYNMTKTDLLAKKSDLEMQIK
jgi:hypothetical protein